MEINKISTFELKLNSPEMHTIISSLKYSLTVLNEDCLAYTATLELYDELRKVWDDK